MMQHGVLVATTIILLIAVVGVESGTLQEQLLDVNLTRRFKALAGNDPIMYKNPKPQADSTDPVAGAHVWYNRMRNFSGNRLTPFDLNLTVWDTNQMEIQWDAPVTVALSKHFDAVYQWVPEEWERGLMRCCKGIDINKTIDNKANMFWELLAETFTNRIFGAVAVEDRLLSYGPDCFDNSGNFNCSEEYIMEAASISIVTHIDGARDTLNPVSRIISWSGKVHQNDVDEKMLEKYPTLYTLNIPGQLQVAGPHRELLDQRPIIAGKQLQSVVRVHGEATEGNYPDYNLLFVPIRHLVTQGKVKNAMVPGSSLFYSDKRAFATKFNMTARALFSTEGTYMAVKQLLPFFTYEYYYMYPEHNFVFNNMSGVDGYKEYLLYSQYGLSPNISSSVKQVSLEIDGQYITSVLSE